MGGQGRAELVGQGHRHHTPFVGDRTGRGRGQEELAEYLAASADRQLDLTVGGPADEV